MFHCESKIKSQKLYFKIFFFFRFTFIRSEMTPARAIQQSPSSFLEDSSTSSVHSSQSLEAEADREQKRWLWEKSVDHFVTSVRQGKFQVPSPIPPFPPLPPRGSSFVEGVLCEGIEREEIFGLGHRWKRCLTCIMVWELNETLPNLDQFFYRAVKQ